MAEIDTALVKKSLDDKLSARVKMGLDICARCGLCADTCHFYRASDGNPKQVPSHKVRWLRELVKRKGQVDEDFMKEMYETVFGDCSMCRRCSLFCPFGIDIASMIAFSRSLLAEQGIMPKALAEAVENYFETGNQMAITDEDWIETIKWMEEELQDELPGATIPIDKHGAEMLYTVNAREPKFYPMDIQLAAKIFYLAGEDWTVSSKPGWDDTNLAMFAGHIKGAAHVVNLTKQRALELGVKRVAITECGHAFRSMKYESPTWLGEPHPFEVVHSVELFADYIRSGRIKIREQCFTEPATYQDPCNVSRNGGLAQQGRYLMRKLCADFRDMMPDGNGNFNYCCGGGGGFMPMAAPFRQRRLASGRVKAEQIRKTGAKVVVSPCHNCFDQIQDLAKEYDLDYRVVQFKEIIDECLIIPEELKAQD